MTFLPEIMPADPRDPESMRYTMKPLRHGWIGKLFLAIEVARERRELAKLDDALLRDIGVTRDGAHREIRRSFWDVSDAGVRSWRLEAQNCLSRPGPL